MTGHDGLAMTDQTMMDQPGYAPRPPAQALLQDYHVLYLEVAEGSGRHGPSDLIYWIWTRTRSFGP